MGSGAREPKRQRLAPSSSASSATASPPWAEGMEYFVPPQVWTDQYSFNFELDKSDQQRPLEPASSSPLQYGPVNAPVSMRPDAWEHPQEQHTVSVMEDVAQDQPPTPEIPAHELSDSSTYSFRAKQRSFAQDLKPTPAFDTSYAAPPCSFDISHQTMAPSTLIDSKTLDSNKNSKVPILPAFEDSPPTVPSRLPASKLASAPTSEKKNEKPPSAEQTPMSSYLRRPLPKKQKTKASQACDQCRQLKTKCDENQPCKSCKEKGLDCRFCDPMPKPTDKTQAAILDGVVALQKSLTQFQSEVQVLRDRVSSLERTITAFAQTDIGDQAKSRRWMLEFMYGILSPQPPPTYWGFPAQAFSSEVPQQVYPGSSQASSTCRMAEANRDYEQPWHSMSPGRAASPKF